MSLYEDLYEICFEIVEKEEKTLTQRGLKLGEEAGETQAEILRFVQAHGLEYKGKSTLGEIAEEAVDTVIVATSILNHLQKEGLEEKEIKEIIERKLGKWKNILKG